MLVLTANSVTDLCIVMKFMAMLSIFIQHERHFNVTPAGHADSWVSSQESCYSSSELHTAPVTALEGKDLSVLRQPCPASTAKLPTCIVSACQMLISQMWPSI